MAVDLATLEAVFLVAMGGWLIVLGGAFLLGRRTVDRVSAVLIALAGVYAILWQQPALLGVGEQLHVAIAQPVFLFLLSGAIFLWTYWLFERHVDRLEVTLSDLEDALALERTLVDVLSHDLRNPISAVKLDLQTLAREHPSLAPELAPIEAEIERASDAMTNGLVFSRLSSPTDDPPTELVNLGALVEKAVENRSPRAEQHDIEIEIEAPDNLRLHASPLLQQAVENLLDNAVKHGPDDSRVRVTVEADPDHARIVVADEGPGLPTEDQARLFERFERGEGEELGSGLGLAIVRRLVELHDGELAVHEEAVDGTAIEIQLPRDRETLSPPPPSSLDRSNVGGRWQEVIG